LGILLQVFAELEPKQENMLHLLGNLDTQQAQQRSKFIEYLNGRSSSDSSHNILAFHNFLLSLWTPEETSIVRVRVRDKREPIHQSPGLKED
jgi:hypothetical protein